MKKRINNFFLFLRCCGHFLMHGRAARVGGAPKIILVTQLGKLGDMVCATPVLRAIRKEFPTARISVLGKALYRELLDHSTLVDYYVITSDPQELRQKTLDTALMTGPHFETLANLYLANIPLIVAPRITNGWSPNQSFFYKLLAYFVITVPHSMIDYAPREYLRILEPLGIATDDTKKHLGFSLQAKEKAQELLSLKSGDKLLVGISPTAGNKIKEWGSGKFAELANRLSETYHARIVIFGARGGEGAAGEVITRLHTTVSYLDVTGRLNLDELKALISMLDVFIAVDTGPVYIAEAFDVATVDIVGPVDENVQPPRGLKHTIVRADVPGYPFLRIMNARIYDEKGARAATEAITVAMVMDAFKKVYAP